MVAITRTVPPEPYPFVVVVEPDDSTLDKAHSESIALYTTNESLFDVVGKLYGLGLRSS